MVGELESDSLDFENVKNFICEICVLFSGEEKFVFENRSVGPVKVL